MKLLCGILLIALAVSDVWTLPARSSPQDDAEVIAVRPARPVTSDTTDFRDFVDTGAENPFLQPNPSSFHFNLGFANTFDDIFRRLRTRLWPIAVGSDESGSGDGDSGEGIFGIRPLTTLNTQNGNTTSTVKVVDGHKVEINETVYGDSNSLFKVRLVNVRPLESGEEVAEGVINNQGDNKPQSAPSTSAPPKRSELQESDEDVNDRREPLEKQPKDNEVRDIDGPQRTTTTTTTRKTLDSSLPIEDSIAEGTENRQQTAHIIMADPMEQQHILEVEQEEQLAQDADTMAHNEDAETETEMPLYDSDSLNENFGNDNRTDSNANSSKLVREREELESSDDEDANAAGPIEMSDTFNDEWATLEEDADAAADAAVDPTNDLNNHIDVFESFVPVVDLSNDIAVNDIAAANPDFPYNPDAELIEMPAEAREMPKFEKLSLTPPMPATPLMK